VRSPRKEQERRGGERERRKRERERERERERGGGGGGVFADEGGWLKVVNEVVAEENHRMLRYGERNEICDNRLKILRINSRNVITSVMSIVPNDLSLSLFFSEDSTGAVSPRHIGSLGFNANMLGPCLKKILACKHHARASARVEDPGMIPV